MRNSFYDILKGYAIFLVVLGHVIQVFLPDFEKSQLFLYIYSFHMPLFMAVSGRFFLKSVDKMSVYDFFKKKFQHLMLPSLTMGGINCGIIGISKYLQHKEFDFFYFIDLFLTGLWFLTVLFVLSIIGCLLRKSLKRYMYIGWIVVLLMFYFSPDVFISHELKYLAPFWVISMATGKIIWDKIPLWVLLIGTVGFTFMLYTYNFNMSMYKMTDDVLTSHFLLLYIFRTLIGFVGIISAILLCKLIVFSKYAKKIFCKIGMVTLPIYVLHQKCMIWNMIAKIKIDSYVLLVLFAIILTAFSIVMYKVLHKNKYIATFMFGEKHLSQKVNIY